MNRIAIAAVALCGILLTGAISSGAATAGPTGMQASAGQSQSLVQQTQYYQPVVGRRAVGAAAAYGCPRSRIWRWWMRTRAACLRSQMGLGRPGLPSLHVAPRLLRRTDTSRPRDDGVERRPSFCCRDANP